MASLVLMNRVIMHSAKFVAQGSKPRQTAHVQFVIALLPSIAMAQTVAETAMRRNSSTQISLPSSRHCDHGKRGHRGVTAGRCDYVRFDYTTSGAIRRHAAGRNATTRPAWHRQAIHLTFVRSGVAGNAEASSARSPPSRRQLGELGRRRVQRPGRAASSVPTRNAHYVTKWMIRPDMSDFGNYGSPFGVPGGVSGSGEAFAVLQGCTCLVVGYVLLQVL